MVRSVDELSRQATRQLEDVARITRVVQAWTERGDRLVQSLGAVVEPPVFALARNIGLFRLGASVFLKTLFGKPQENETTQEE